MGDVLIDKDNAIEIVNLKIQLEATEDKILVLVDQYKSGYECENCGGIGKVKSPVVEGALKDCEDCGGKGSLLVIPEISKSLPTLGTVVSLGPKCQWSMRQADYIDQFSDSPSHPPRLSFSESNSSRNILIRPGAKVLFQPHVGTLIPFKGNIRIKAMREHEPLCVVYGSEVDSKDFLDFDTPFEQRF